MQSNRAQQVGSRTVYPLDRPSELYFRHGARTEQQKTLSEGINLVGPTNDSSRPYILSAYPQADIVKRYRLWAGLYGAGFFLLGGAGVWLFNTRFG
ncbi:MAG: hypothetical protein A2V92_06610 [Candidatus Muproteobacteria bacterium RBG_16_65_31]|uniref:Uncharacterized protein n=1 Tax=Candidatus Muproteobacteria bacterium RBG_16_65_31 TaxID=1817759 RepID=A0A1F6TFV2_9PROT|nr:MAG: hypothetical protein A2V92_06610 [Candidatus Muproteobacteria bacterium RBG_16_65_31]